MESKVVLITGAKGGLGSAVTEAFLAAGARVAGVSRSIRQQDFPQPNFTAVPGELATAGQAQAVAAAVAGQFGRIDALVHLVGGFAAASIADTTDALWAQMFDLNVRTAFNIAQAVLPYMRQGGGGRIVAIGSRAAVDTGPNIAAYAATKAALVSLIRTIALEHKGAGVTANVLLPGTIDTAANRASDPNADFSKWVQPSALAGLILWLTGDAGAELNGAAIPVFGRDA